MTLLTYPFHHFFIVFIYYWGGYRVTFNNMSVISWRSVLLVEETGVPWENHGPIASHCFENSTFFSHGLKIPRTLLNLSPSLRLITEACPFTFLSTCCEFESRSWRGVLDTTLCDKVCQWLAMGPWFSQGTPVSSTNKTSREARIFFPEFNIRLYDKNSESDYFFFSSTKIRIFFSATLGIRIFF
jgi:hypothetical protein